MTKRNRIILNVTLAGILVMCLLSPLLLWHWVMDISWDGDWGPFGDAGHEPHDYHYTLVETDEFGLCLYRQDRLANDPDKRVLVEKCVSQLGQDGPWTIGESGLGWFVYHQQGDRHGPTYFSEGHQWVRCLWENGINETCIHDLPPCDCDYGQRARALRAEMFPPS